MDEKWKRQLELGQYAMSEGQRMMFVNVRTAMIKWYPIYRSIISLFYLFLTVYAYMNDDLMLAAVCFGIFFLQGQFNQQYQRYYGVEDLLLKVLKEKPEGMVEQVDLFAAKKGGGK